jgi:GT2 family glycosyltransferase
MPAMEIKKRFTATQPERRLAGSPEGAQLRNRLVSVVIPCYRGAPFLPDAIESCLRQTYGNLEIIIVDDCSPDNCAEIAERYAASDGRVRVLRRETNGGVSEAFNTGFRAATGVYYTRLAQDDVFMEEAVERMVSVLERDKDVGLVYCDYQAMDSTGRLLHVVNLPVPQRALAWGNCIGFCVMWRREVWQKVGQFDQNFDSAEDYDYWLRVNRHFRIERCAGKPAMLFRVHPDMGSTRFAAKQEVAIARLLRRSFTEGRHGLSRWLRFCKASSLQACAFAPGYSETGCHGTALLRLMRSSFLWPFPLTECCSQTYFLRGKLFVVILLRLLGVRREKSERSGATLVSAARERIA